ncbi:MAG: hypothetical protein JWO22_1691 [Frankiales bacterium]|nr:hypothetical protein [Frankiales bacterium]
MNQRLFSVSLAAVLTAIGFAVSALGWIALAVYAVLVVALVTFAVRRQRPTDDGRTCSCCTTTVFTPVTVVDAVDVVEVT